MDDWLYFSEITCDPPYIPNGNISYKSLQLGARVNYSCDVGYVLDGMPGATCLENGTNTVGIWSEPTPNCIGESEKFSTRYSCDKGF